MAADVADRARRADGALAVAREIRAGAAPRRRPPALQGTALLPAVHDDDPALARAHLADPPALTLAARRAASQACISSSVRRPSRSASMRSNLRAIRGRLFAASSRDS